MLGARWIARQIGDVLSNWEIMSETWEAFDRAGAEVSLSAGFYEIPVLKRNPAIQAQVDS